MKRAIQMSRTKEEVYDCVSKSILIMVALGYDYNMILDWNVGTFFDILKEVEKIQKAKAGIKNGI